MPDITPNLGIKKPLGNENVSRASFNENWDIIDATVAPANKAQMAKLTKDDGYVTVPSETDLNNLMTSGFYYGNNIANAPEGSVYHRIVVMMASSTSGSQEATTNGGNRYIRNITSGTWSRWVLQLNDNAPTWTNIVLQNGAVANNARTPKFTKQGNLVIVQGEIGNITGVIGTLPVGFRPKAYSLTFRTSMATVSAGQDSTISVGLDGTINVLVNSSTSNGIALNGIAFIAEQ